MIKSTQIILLSLLLSSTAIAASLEDLDFMTGRWERSSPEGVAEEWWMSAGGNTKIAAFRWAQGDKILAIELVVISAEDNDIFLRFKHFRANYDPWEKDEPNTYLLESVQGDKATFINIAPREGIPDVMTYRIVDGDLEFRGTNNPESAIHDSDLVIRFKPVD